MALGGKPKRILSTGFRLWALGARFLLIFLLARFLAPAEVGLYGLVTATVSYVIYALGMDMYTYTTREIIKSERASWRAKLKSHGAFLVLVAVIVLPLSLVLFVLGLLPWGVAIWFFLVLVSEHVGMEIDRLLVSMSQQFAGSIVILIRQAGMPTLFVPLIAFVPAARNLEYVFAAWAGFNGIAIVVGLVFLTRFAPPGGDSAVNGAWIRRGVMVALPFLIGTLCLRLLFTADRQVVGAVAGLEVLGAYTLPMTVAAGLSSLLAVGVHQFSYPRLVKAASDGDMDGLRAGIRSLWLQSVVIIGIVFIAVLVLHDWLTSLMGDEIYRDYAWVMPTAVGVVGVYNLALVPHYALYALHADRLILFITVGATLLYIAVVAVAILIAADIVFSVLLALLLASLVLLGVKQLAYRSMLKRKI